MIGRRLGHYEVLEPLGAGGMGEVYRARDERLGRDVALKFLPQELMDDPERRARFEREARTLASLNHPNIATIHGLEEAEGLRFLAIELVDGEDLSSRIRRGAIPVEEAVRIAAAIADGLEAAHEQGIVHRDLKPANIRLDADGKPRILDFGLARAAQGDVDGDVSFANSPTITAQYTQPGVVLGTAAYMSPEQARGKPVDRRADIWSFGCVLFEMLSGQAPFAGESITDILAEIVKTEPDWTQLPKNTPPRVKVLLWRCLQKDPKRRLRDIGEARYELGEAPSDPSGSFSMLGSTQAPTPRPWAAFAVIAVVALGVGALIGGQLLGDEQQALAPAPPMIFELPQDRDLPLVRLFDNHFAISPDGQTILYSTTAEGQENLRTNQVRIAVRELGKMKARRLSNTAGGLGVEFSPDGRDVAFFDPTNGRWQRMPLLGGGVQTLAQNRGRESPAWGNDGYVYITGGFGLHRVPENGGELETLIRTADDGGERLSAPFTTSDGRWILYTLNRNDREPVLEALDLNTRERKLLADGDAVVTITPANLFLYRQNGTVLGQRIDPARMELEGPAEVLMQQLGSDFALSETGTLVFTPGQNAFTRWGRFVWITRDGTQLPAFDGELLLQPRYPRISPDGKRVAYTVGPGGEGQIWVRELEGDRPAINLTFEGHNTLPTWRPDGKTLTFKRQNSAIAGDLVELPAGGGELTPRPLVVRGIEQEPITWLDENSLLFTSGGAQTAAGSLLRFDRASGQVDSVVATRFAEGYGTASPDGMWIAYEWDRSGRFEIWARRMADGHTMRISHDGGADPVWSRDGSEIYYQEGGILKAVAVSGRGADLEFGAPVELFRDRFEVSVNFTPRSYDVHPDGRFLMIQLTQESRDDLRPLVRLNWIEEMERAFADKH